MARTTLSDDTFKIEKGVPLPTAAPSNCSTYPFEKMAIGDSFAIPTERYKAVAAAASYHGKINRQKFSVRRDHSGDGYRCWRIA